MYGVVFLLDINALLSFLACGNLGPGINGRSKILVPPINLHRLQEPIKKVGTCCFRCVSEKKNRNVYIPINRLFVL